MQVVNRFSGKYRFLSNFYPSKIFYEGESYATVEHAYQASKFEDESIKKIIRLEPKPGRAKRLGRRFKLRKDWDNMRYGIMYTLLRIKFISHPELKDKLIKTDDATLIEGNYWHDNYWGGCYCPKCINISGQNKLGKLLMILRSELQ